MFEILKKLEERGEISKKNFIIQYQEHPIYPSNQREITLRNFGANSYAYI